MGKVIQTEPLPNNTMSCFFIKHVDLLAQWTDYNAVEDA